MLFTLLIIVVGIRLCFTTQINANWILTAMFIKNRHCHEIIELIELGLVTESDLVPVTNVLKKGYFFCKDLVSKHQFAAISDDERLFYSLIGTVAVEDLLEHLHDLSGKSGTSIQIQYKRAFLLGCAAGNVPVLEQAADLVSNKIANLGFVLACSRLQLGSITFLLDHITPDRMLVERSMKIACMLGNMPIVSLLMETFEFDDNEYLAAAGHGGNLDIVKLLISDNRFNSEDDIGEALRWAIIMDHMNVSQYILEKHNTFRHLAFKQSCKYNRVDLVKSLLEGHQYLNLRAGLDAACLKGHLEIVLMVIGTGQITADSDSLYYAAHSDSLDLVTWILKQPDIDVNIKIDDKTLFATLVEDRVSLGVLDLIISHENFAIDGLFSAFSLKAARELLQLPTVHRMLNEFKGDVLMRVLDCGAKIKRLVPLCLHPCVSVDQISAIADILDVEERIFEQFQVIMAVKSDELDRCIEICINGHPRSLQEIGIQCAAANGKIPILLHLFKMYEHNTFEESDDTILLLMDYVVGMCRSLGATNSLNIIWEWLGHRLSLITDLLSRTRPFQARVIKRKIDNPTMNQHLDLICKKFDTLIRCFGTHENLVNLAKSYRDHFLIMISIYETCPRMPLEYSDEMLKTLLKYS